jgi:hypothetical protein
MRNGKNGTRLREEGNREQIVADRKQRAENKKYSRLCALCVVAVKFVLSEVSSRGVRHHPSQRCAGCGTI